MWSIRNDIYSSTIYDKLVDFDFEIVKMEIFLTSLLMAYIFHSVFVSREYVPNSVILPTK